MLIFWKSLGDRRAWGSPARWGRYLVDCGVLPQRQVPEAAANLVSALADCAQEGKRIDIRQQQGHSPRRRPGPHPPGAAYPV